MDNNVLTLWNEFRELVAATDENVQNSLETISAGTSARRRLRQVRNKCNELIKASRAYTASQKTARAARKAS